MATETTDSTRPQRVKTPKAEPQALAPPVMAPPDAQARQETVPEPAAAKPPAVITQAAPRPLIPTQTALKREPEAGDIVLIRGRGDRHALCVVVGRDDRALIVQFLRWQGKKLPPSDKLPKLQGIVGDAFQSGRKLGQWLEPRYRPLFFRVSGLLAERGRIVGRDLARVGDDWQDSALQGGRTLLIDTTWSSLTGYYLCSGAFDEALDLSRDLSSRIRRRRLRKREQDA